MSTDTASAMPVSRAVLWLLPGGTFTAIDAWLSIQSVFGLLHGFDLMGAVAAAVIGVLLTSIAVGEPVLRDAFEGSTGFWALWVVLVIFDIVTSILGAIWYGALNQDLGTPIHPSEIEYGRENASATVAFVLLALLAIYSCRRFGQALRVLVIEEPRKRSGRP